MDFNIRAISLAESVKADARVVVGDCLGKEVLFRTGVNILITLPDTKGDYGLLPEPERLLTALAGWTRVYRYPEGEHDSIHIIASRLASGPPHRNGLERASRRGDGGAAHAVPLPADSAARVVPYLPAHEEEQFAISGFNRHQDRAADRRPRSRRPPDPRGALPGG